MCLLLYPSTYLPCHAGTCWAYVTVDSIASAYAILRKNATATPPHLSASQLFDSDTCLPSCPVDAMENVAAGDGLIGDGEALKVGAKKLSYDCL